MKDFTRMKYHLKEASELLLHINDRVQELPDQSNLADPDEIFEIIRDLIRGLTEFKLHFDIIYEPFKSTIEPIIEAEKEQKNEQSVASTNGKSD